MTRLFIMMVFSLGLCVSNISAKEVKKILFIGNSITAHAPSESLKWKGHWGMAATLMENDFVHKTYKLISDYQGYKPELFISGRNAGAAGEITNALGKVNEYQKIKADIIIVQLGENERGPEAKEELFSANYLRLLKALRDDNEKAVIVCVGVWHPSCKEEWDSTGALGIKDSCIKAAADKIKCLFVGTSPIGHIRGNASWSQTQYSAGVKWHPGDAGMEAYAKAIFQTLKPYLSQTSKSNKASKQHKATLIGIVPQPQQLQRRTLLTGVIPEPQEVYEFVTDTDSFVFGSDTVFVVENSADRIGAELLQQDLHKRFGLDVAVIEGPPTKNIGSCVLLARSRTTDGTLSNAYPVEQLGSTQDEGYRMAVNAAAIVIQGHDARGALYGIQTLRQLLLSDATVAPIAIRDWPEMQWRVSYCGLIDIEKIKVHIRRCARLKMNAVILESYWSGPQNWWYNHTGGRQQLARQFFDECRRYSIEPIPFVQGLGWGYGVTDLEPMAAEGVFGEDESVVLHYNHGTDLKRPNIVTTPDTAPIIVTSKTDKPYKLDVDFKIIPGVTVRPYKESNKRWQLQALPGGNIADGQTVLVSYNAVTPGPHKSYCPAEPRTYKLIDRTIDRVMQTYQPNVIHIGHDELFNSMTDSRCLNSGMTESQLILRDVMHWYNRIKKNNPDITIMMWSDLIWLRTSGVLLDVVDQLPKDIIMCHWRYGTGKKVRDVMARQSVFEQEHGFQRIGASSGYKFNNNLDWYDTIANHLAPDDGSALGMMFTYWGDGALLQSCLPASAELMWSGKKMDRSLFARIGSATSRLRGMGLALTFDLVAQREVLLKRFNSELLSGCAPREISSKFHKDLLGDEEFFVNLYGAKRWQELRNVTFEEQHVGMLQKLSIFVDAMAGYAQAEYELSQGNNKKVSEKLRVVVDILEQIGFLDKNTAARFRDNVELPASEKIFGFKLNCYRPVKAVGHIITPISDAMMQRTATEDYELIKFTRPVALARIEGEGLSSRTVKLSQDGITFTDLTVAGDLAMADGSMIVAVKIIPAGGKAIFYEQRQAANISSLSAAIAPVIDGKLNEQVWQNAVPATGFFTSHGHQAIEQTCARVAWDSNNLYVAFQCDRRPGESIKSRHLERDGKTYEDESVQLFLDTNLDRKSYYQFAVNAAGAVMDRSTVEGRGRWDSDVSIATRVKDTVWTVEMAIPLTSLGITDSLANQNWGINFCRSQWGTSSVLSSWALLNSGQAYYFLQPARFGKVTFTL